MKKCLLLFFVFIFSFCFSQENKPIYILIDRATSNIKIKDFGYEFSFYIKSEDKRFQHDTYVFNLFFKDENTSPLVEMAKRIDLKSVDYILAVDFFKSKTPCEIHEELTLRKVCFIKQIPSFDNTEKLYQYWSPQYYGTVKNIVMSANEVGAKKYFKGT